AREVAADNGEAEACEEIAKRIAACRWALERAIASSMAPEDPQTGPGPGEIARMVKGLFGDETTHAVAPAPPSPNPLPRPFAQTWSRIITLSRHRLTGAQRIELTDVVDGVEAARQIGRLA